MKIFGHIRYHILVFMMVYNIHLFFSYKYMKLTKEIVNNKAVI